MDERVHLLELETERTRWRRDTEKVKQREAEMTKEMEKQREQLERLVEKCERAKIRETKVSMLREESEELRHLLERAGSENANVLFKATRASELARGLTLARKENERLRKQLKLSTRRLDHALCENITLRKNANANTSTLKKALSCAAALSKDSEAKLLFEESAKIYVDDNEFQEAEKNDINKEETENETIACA